MAQEAVQITPTDEILAAAMELPETDRVKLVHELLRSLSPLPDEDVHPEAPFGPDPALTAELQRRRRAYLSGEMSSVSIEDLESELDQVLTAIRR